MKNIEKILSGQWVIPMGDGPNFIEKAAIAIDQGKIVAIGPQDEIKASFVAQEVIDRPGHVLLPGFVNCHTHMAMSLLRGIADDLPLMEWLEKHIWPAEGASVSADFVRDGTDLALAEMIKGGVTCINDMYFFAPEVAESVHRSGIRGRVADSILNVPMPWANSVDACFENTIKACEAVKQYDLVDACIAPHAPYTTDEAILSRVLDLSNEYNVPIHMHVQETFYELEQHRLMYNDERPMQTLDRLGLISDRFLAVHMTQTSQEDIDILLEKGGSTVHCPESNMKLASGPSPIMEKLRQGVNVALGTDGAASNNNLDMFGEMRSAAMMAKLVDQDPVSLPAYDVLKMATIGGAKALGFADRTGSLEVGNDADIIAVNLNDVCTAPVYNPISQLVYAAHAHQVTDSWVAGKPVLSNRELMNLDEQAILTTASQWRSKVLDSMGK